MKRKDDRSDEGYMKEVEYYYCSSCGYETYHDEDCCCEECGGHIEDGFGGWVDSYDELYRRKLKYGY